jgi:hypothetical protein
MPPAAASSKAAQTQAEEDAAINVRLLTHVSTVVKGRPPLFKGVAQRCVRLSSAWSAPRPPLCARCNSCSVAAHPLEPCRLTRLPNFTPASLQLPVTLSPPSHTHTQPGSFLAVTAAAQTGSAGDAAAAQLAFEREMDGLELQLARFESASEANRREQEGYAAKQQQLEAQIKQVRGRAAGVDGGGGWSCFSLCKRGFDSG